MDAVIPTVNWRATVAAYKAAITRKEQRYIAIPRLAEAVRYMTEVERMSPAQVGHEFGRTRAWVRAVLGFYKMPEHVQRLFPTDRRSECDLSIDDIMMLLTQPRDSVAARAQNLLAQRRKSNGRACWYLGSSSHRKAFAGGDK